MIASHFLSIFRPIIVLLIIILFVGCGGSGGGGNSSSSFSISGIVSGAVSSGVIMTLSGTSTGTDTTDASGNYTFSGLANGSYTITPSLSGYVFYPVSEALKINGANITPINFTATASTNPTYNISGTVTLSSGWALPGVTVTLSVNNYNSGTAATDANGDYTFTGLTNGSYTITPSLTGYTFNPASLAITLNGANVTSINFIVATAPPTSTHSISGTVTLSSGSALSGVTVTLSGVSSGTATTDKSGNYTFTGLTNGSYTITPSLTGYTFSHASTSVMLNGANSTSNNFIATATTAPPYSISGTVTWNSGGVLEGVNMMLAVTYNTTTATDSNGNYIFKGLTNGDYTITPSLNGYRFNATSVGIKINGANVTSINFIGVKE